ncbi:carbohydrate ABC transporter permease [Paenibacillus lautus]|uniref:carbohydrate ABC transporter permease n=1 Tax=Paenibacillus lautus TaxID=1401 RepID=UPI003D2B4181
MRESASGRVFSVFVHTVLIIIALTCILPFLHLIALSISEGQAVDLGQVLFWPVGLDFTAYKYFFQNTPALRAFGNSVIITLGGTALSMLTTVLTAYPLSRRYLYARKPLTTAALFTMLFSGGMIPTYLVMNNLHLTNTYWSLWFVGLISTYNMLIMKSFFENIPSEVTESDHVLVLLGNHTSPCPRIGICIGLFIKVVVRKFVEGTYHLKGKNLRFWLRLLRKLQENLSLKSLVNECLNF